jgi:DNA-binding transcriptional LysR family regulator
MRITLRQLEIFAAIFQEQTVTGAARRIGLSQAATSQALAELENLLERRLFDRHGRRVVLNTNGRELLPVSIQVLDRVREIEAGVSQQPLNVKLYASLTTGNYMLPALIARFARRHPDARFHVAIGNTERVISSLLHFESDAGWIEGTSGHPDLTASPWREDELIIAAAPDHPLAGRHVTPDQLANARWVLREEGSGTREVFEQAIQGKFELKDHPLEMGGIGAIKRAAMAGGGLACLSQSAVEFELKLRVLRRVYAPWLNLRRQITVLLHREKYLDSRLREFLRFCRVQPATRPEERTSDR